MNRTIFADDEMAERRYQQQFGKFAHPQGVTEDSPQDEPTPSQMLTRLEEQVERLEAIPTPRRRRRLVVWERLLIVAVLFGLFAIWGPAETDIKAVFTAAIFGMLAIVFAWDADEDAERLYDAGQEADDDDR